MNEELCDPREDSSSFTMTSLLSCVPYQIPWSCVAIHVLHTEVMKKGCNVFLYSFQMGFLDFLSLSPWRELDAFVFLYLNEVTNAKIRTEKSSEIFRPFVRGRNSRNAVGCSEEFPNIHYHPRLYDCTLPVLEKNHRQQVSNGLMSF